MSLLEQKNPEAMITAINSLWQKGCLAAGDGNFSFKEGGEIWITPSGRRKADLNPDEFVLLGKSEKASSESLMHKTVFENAEKANFVFHAHPPTATAYSISTDESFLPENLVSELVLSAGQIPIVPYAKPGTQEMGDNLIPFLPSSRILLLKHHGALTWGETLEEALNGMERLEHSCEIFFKAKTLGSLQTLSEEDVKWLKAKRKEIGERVL